MKRLRFSSSPAGPSRLHEMSFAPDGVLHLCFNSIHFVFTLSHTVTICDVQKQKKKLHQNLTDI